MDRRDASGPPPCGQAGVDGDTWLQAALAIAHRLHDSAREHNGTVRWTGDDLLGHDAATARVVRQDTGAGLYSGAAGIGWFLAHAGAWVGDAALVATGVAALEGAVAEYRARLGPASLSLFGGASGVALAALQVAMRTGAPRLHAGALELAHGCATCLIGSRWPGGCDLIGGVAGIVTALAACHRLAPDSRFVAACNAGCQELMRRRCPEIEGTSWREPSLRPDAPALCGIGHGASGVAWALFEGGQVTGEADFAEVADQACQYERSWFDAGTSTWPDLREPPAPGSNAQWPGGMSAWCHGAIGIGAVRWAIHACRGDPAALAEAGASVFAARRVAGHARRLLAQGTPGDATLCHGLGGVAELLLLAYEVTGLHEHLRAARRVGDLSLDILDANHGEWTTGLAGAREVPGLMVGQAGIGVTMLRLHSTQSIGSPLLPGRPPCPTPGGGRSG